MSVLTGSANFIPRFNSSFGALSLASENLSKQGHMGILGWTIVGRIAGWLAGLVMKGGGYGVGVDIVLGIVGGILGGWLFGTLGIWRGGGMFGSVIVAFVGAVILVWINRRAQESLMEPVAAGLGPRLSWSRQKGQF